MHDTFHDAAAMTRTARKAPADVGAAMRPTLTLRSDTHAPQRSLRDENATARSPSQVVGSARATALEQPAGVMAARQVRDAFAQAVSQAVGSARATALEQPAGVMAARQVRDAFAQAVSQAVGSARATALEQPAGVMAARQVRDAFAQAVSQAVGSARATALEQPAGVMAARQVRDAFAQAVSQAVGNARATVYGCLEQYMIEEGIRKVQSVSMDVVHKNLYRGDGLNKSAIAAENQSRVAGCEAFASGVSQGIVCDQFTSQRFETAAVRMHHAPVPNFALVPGNKFPIPSSPEEGKIGFHRRTREDIVRKPEWIDTHHDRTDSTYRNDNDASLRFLVESGYPTASNEMREAISDISRHPNPDVTGAIHHSMMACESIARSVTGRANQTLGRLVPHLPIPEPLRIIVEKLWGYASEHGRHCKEGRAVDPSDARVVVSVALTICKRLAECKVTQ